MQHEIVQTRNLQDEWRVEVIDDTNDGSVQVALFSGPNARTRAEEYADWKNGELRTTQQRAARPSIDRRLGV